MSSNLSIIIQSFYHITIFVKRCTFFGLASKHYNDRATEKVIPIKLKIPKKYKPISGFSSDSYFFRNKRNIIS